MPAHHQKNVGPAESPIPDNAVVRRLIARIGALLRQPAESRDAVLRVGPLELDLIEHTAKRGDFAIDLRPREFRLPSLFGRHGVKLAKLARDQSAQALTQL